VRAASQVVRRAGKVGWRTAGLLFWRGNELQEGDAMTRLREFLEEEHATAHFHPHRPAFTAQEVAATEHVPGRAMAKVVMAVADGRMVMLVLPAPLRVDLARVRDGLRAGDVRLAGEDEFASLFPDCEAGAMPPFGHLYGMDVYVDPALADSGVVLFEAGTHSQVGIIPFDEFQRLEHPHLLSFAV
jgi:Ala-tRNA(Pro) deacylase